MTWLLDSNIFLRMVDLSSSQRAIAREAVDRLIACHEQIFLVPQNIYEFWVVATRTLAENGLGMTPSVAHARVVELMRAFMPRHDRKAVFAEWQRLVVAHDVKGKPAHDAKLVAAMVVHRIQNIVTFNKADFSRYNEITALTPEDVLSRIELPAPPPQDR